MCRYIKLVKGSIPPPRTSVPFTLIHVSTMSPDHVPMQNAGGNNTGTYSAWTCPLNGREQCVPLSSFRHTLNRIKVVRFAPVYPDEACFTLRSDYILVCPYFGIDSLPSMIQRNHGLSRLQLFVV